MSGTNREYTNGLPGKDWDIMSIDFNAQNIIEIEKDAIAVFKCIAERPELAAECWLFREGGSAPLSEEDTDALLAFQKKMENSGSWVLDVSGRFVTLCKLNMLKVIMSAFSGEQKPFDLIADNLREKGYRKAQTAEEDALIDAIIAYSPSYLQIDSSGLAEFHSWK